ncbi:MAG: protein phosphatase 2C domain-containing protein [Spirochaetaceae bacterium]|nr:protein phosphatase 2C domain-containing protein [Spirochaetaceae bacterium]
MWTTINFELCGTGHKKEGIPCQDKTYSASDNGVIVSALADGAGSAVFSHFGAETAVRSVCEYLTNNFLEMYNSDGVSAKQKIVDFLVGQLTQKAREMNCRLKDLASTLLAVAIYQNECIIIHIGDGIIGCLRNGNVQILSYPNNGEFSNSTYFVTTDNVVKYIEIKKGSVNRISGFVLMSDGTSESFYNKREKMFSDGVIKIMQHSILLNDITALEVIKNNFDLVLENTLDDCSIAMVIRKSKELRTYSELSHDEKIRILGCKTKYRLLKKKQKKIDAIIKIIESGEHNIDIICKRIKSNKSFVNQHILSYLRSSGIISGTNEIYLNLR